VGFVSGEEHFEKDGRSRIDRDDPRLYFRFATFDPTTGEPVPGNGNGGHEGAVYGTLLSAPEKDALVEYLKKF
jgi:hypothetical protein